MISKETRTKEDELEGRAMKEEEPIEQERANKEQ
jgi:hypothetical protein